MMVLSADNTDNSVGIQLGAAKASFPAALAIAAEAVDAALELLLPKPAGLHARVQEAMRYAVFAGGKRLRPFLVMQCAALFDVEARQAARTAAAIESLHTYSLVHDDLPCMDDDDLRRGRATTHKAFDEETAVLAGDALLTVAFEILADAGTHNSSLVRCRLIGELARAAGSNGMVGGQMIDMQAPADHLGADDVITLQQMKTGALFEFCCVAGAMLGQGSVADEERLRSYARDVGLLFQITDDLLDVLGSTEKTGKAVRKDNGQGKKTLVSLWGINVARRKALRLAEHAAKTMAYYGPAADALQALPAYLIDRES